MVSGGRVVLCSEARIMANSRGETMFARIIREVEETPFGQFRYEGVEKGTDRSLLFKSARSLPFLEGEALYHLVVDRSEGKDEELIRVLGVLQVALPSEADIKKSALAKAAAGVKQGVRKTNRCLAATTEHEFFKRMNAEFDKETRDAYNATRRKILGGSADVSEAALRAALVCIGFADRAVARATTFDSEERFRWFLPVGSGDASSSSEPYENFFDFFSAVRKNVPAATRVVESIIKENPEKFFSSKTRAVFLRDFGAADPTAYVAYCAHKLGVSVDENALVDVKDEGGDPFIVGESRDKRLKLESRGMAFSVANFLLRRSFVASLVTLAKIFKEDRLIFSEEKGECVDEDSLFKSAFENLSGVKGVVAEVHALCAEKRVLLKFSKCDETNAESQRLTFLNGKRALKLDVVIRDAHLLTADSFLHFFWKLSRRIEFKTVTLTHRLDWDQAFIGPFWRFVQKKYLNLSRSPCPSSISEDDASGEGGGGDVPLAEAARHLCVTTTAAAAADAKEFETNDWVFTADGCLFGKAFDKKNGLVTVKTPVGIKKTVKCAVVYKCKVNGKGAPLVPVSALLVAARKAKRHVWPTATLLVGEDFSSDESLQAKKVVEKIAGEVEVRRSEACRKNIVDDEREAKVLAALKI